MKRRRWWSLSPSSLILAFILEMSLVPSMTLGVRPPVPTDCISSPYKNGLALKCSLSAINSAEEKTDFSVVPHDHTLSLTIICRDNVLSQLEPGGFASLLHLRQLTLKGCQLRSIPAKAFLGLENLETLIIHTRNLGVLTLSRESFSGLNNLEYLDLSGNSIRHLASECFCTLPKLYGLNLSNNDISSLGDLEKSNLDCLSDSLRTIDLSKNSLSGFDKSLSTSLPKLQELRLSYNRLAGTLDFDFIAQKPALEFVDLSNNQISNLHPNTFQENPRLKRITLSNNSISYLPDETLFSRQHKFLEILEISGNHLSSFNAQLLAGLRKLSTLDLSYNNIVSLDSAAAMEDLTKLQTLKLDHNKLARLPMLPLPSLRSLTLSYNDFRGRLMPENMFHLMPSLSYLLLSNNYIDDLPKDLFVNTTSLTVLDLSNNGLTGDVPVSINSLIRLQTFAISNNLIDNLGNLQLKGLWRLQANGNRLTSITKDNFKGLPTLQVLDLSSNRISSIEKVAFDGNKPLQAIRLDLNQLQRIDGLFHELPNLTWLNVSANEIALFDYAMIPPSLHWLDLHKNKIRALENYFGIEGKLQLNFLDASFNQITEIGPQNVPDEIQTLQLNENRIETVVPYTFFKKTKLVKVDLSVNKLESIDRNALRLPVSANGDKGDENNDISDTLYPSAKPSKPEFYLGGNPIKCDCNMAWFKGVNDIVASEVSLLNFPHVVDLESIYCELIFSKEKSFLALVDTRSEEFLCTYKTHCFALCHCCDYDACDCEMTCPDNCTCYHDNTWSKNIAECSNAQFTDLPDQLPMDATEIFLDGNTLTELRSHNFIGRKNLKVLYLNNSLLSAVENRTFNGLAMLEKLHLEGNSLARLQGDEFHGLGNLKELYLHNNKIRSISNVTFESLHRLQVLTLHNNHLTDFPVWQLSVNQMLSSVKLASNPWTCECTFIGHFAMWLESKAWKNVVIDKTLIECYDGPSSSHRVLELKDSELCFDYDVKPDEAPTTKQVFVTENVQHQQADFSQASSDTKTSEAIFHDFLPIFLGILSGIILVLVVIITIFVYRDEMRLWLYTKYGIRCFHRVDGMGNDFDKIFDAFVVYSAKDDVFARQVLAPELELGVHVSHSSSPNSSHHQNPYLYNPSPQHKLCLFYRDLPMNQHYGYLSDTIVQAAEASRRMILILSEHFLKSEWARYDVKSGMHQALRSFPQGRGLIVILVGDHAASRPDLDPDLRLCLKSGRTVILNWGDRLFWQKLRYAMPDLMKSNNRLILPYDEHPMSMSAFSPDTESFRYETYSRAVYGGQQPPLPTLPRGMTDESVATMTTNRSSSNTYQSLSTPDEQESTRTMTIHM